VWVVLPLTAGAALGAALRPHSEPVRVAAAAVMWAAWLAVLVGTLVPAPLGLTALRLVAPGAAVAAVLAAATDRPSLAASALAVTSTLIALLVAFTPAAARLYVNGPAYPNELRLPLAPPGPLLFGPLEVAWAATVGAPLAGVLLLAARQWLAGTLVLVAGGALAFVGARALHGLSRRWVVFVPAGLVLHDPMALVDPVLFERPLIETLRPAPAGSDSLDLTQRARGLPLELVLWEKVPVVLVRARRPGGDPGSSARLLFTPSRPGVVLQEAAARRIPIG
jgi:hypothetical protein